GPRGRAQVDGRALPFPGAPAPPAVRPHMATLTKADAARQLGIARSTLYKLIDQGKLSPTPDGLVDQAELVRVAAYADIIKGRTRTSADRRVTPALYRVGVVFQK